MIVLLALLQSFSAQASGWADASSDGSHLITASRGGAVRVWALPVVGPGVDLSPTGRSRSRASGVCVRDGRVAIATDWGATVQIRGVDGAEGPTLRPAVRRVADVSCLEGGGWAVIGLPKIPVSNSETVDTGPGIVFFYNSLGLPIARWAIPSGALAMTNSGVRGVAVLAASGQVWEGNPGMGPPRITDLLPGKEGRALTRARSGALVAASVEQVCIAGGACFAANGGARRLAASATAIAVGGFESTVVYTPAGQPLLTIPGWPGMLQFDDDGDLTVIVGATLTRFDGRTWREVERLALGSEVVP